MVIVVVAMISVIQLSLAVCGLTKTNDMVVVDPDMPRRAKPTPRLHVLMGIAVVAMLSVIQFSFAVRMAIVGSDMPPPAKLTPRLLMLVAIVVVAMSSVIQMMVMVFHCCFSTMV